MLISAIMPTRARPLFITAALDCFISQTWYEKELVILDDSDCPSFATPPQIEGVRYYRMAQRLAIGAKRNICCSRAEGDVICHWDDDDYSSPYRMEEQAERLIKTGAMVTGYHSMRFTDGARWWQYAGSEKDYALGTSLMYRREYWEAHPFPADKNVGEDSDFIHPARQAGTIACGDADGFMWARNHSQNTDERKMGVLWREISDGVRASV